MSGAGNTEGVTSPAGGLSPLSIESLLAAALTPPPTPPAPTKITLKALREGIASTLDATLALNVLKHRSLRSPRPRWDVLPG